MVCFVTFQLGGYYPHKCYWEGKYYYPGKWYKVSNSVGAVANTHLLKTQPLLLFVHSFSAGNTIANASTVDTGVIARTINLTGGRHNFSWISINDAVQGSVSIEASTQISFLYS